MDTSDYFKAYSRQVSQSIIEFHRIGRQLHGELAAEYADELSVMVGRIMIDTTRSNVFDDATKVSLN